MRYVLAALVCLLAITTTQAQIYRFKVYSSNTGLPSNAIYSIFQDRKGFLWFGSDGGVCRYDGLNYITYSVRQGLVDASVRGIFEDQQGNIWINTKGGVSRFDGQSFINYTTTDGLASNETRCGLSTRDGTIWIGTSLGLSRFDGSRFTSYGSNEGLLPGPIWALIEDREGKIWVGSRGGGLARFDGSRFTVYGRSQGLPDEFVFGLAQDRTSGLWLATDGGLCYFDGTKFRCYGLAEGLSNQRLSSVLIDRHGRIWCTTFGGGICRLENEHFTVFNRNNGLPDNYLSAIYEDFEGNIWCGTQSSGAFRFGNEKFANFTSASGIGEGLVTGIAEARDGTLWFSSINSGLAVLDTKGATRRYRIKDGLMEEGLWAIYIDSQGRVWTGGHEGASYFNGRSFTNFPLAKMGAHSRITAIIEDKKGRIWFGSSSSTSNGIVAYDGKKFTLYSTEQGLTHNQVNSFMVDKAGSLWICSEGGLSHFDGTYFTNYYRSNGLPDKRAVCAYEDEKGYIWVGTADGLCRYDGHNFQVYRNEEGLSDNVVRAITSREGVLWIGTSRGITTFDGQRFRNYTTKDGLISNDIYVGACLRQRDGSIWFGTTEGAVRYQPIEESNTGQPPRVYIDRLRLPEQNLAAQSAHTLVYHQNNIIIEFLGLSFTDEEAVRYSYLLENFEREWSTPTNTRSVRFTNLPPGQYRFLVKARSAAGLWSEPQVMLINILPPYWQTWWFRLLILGFIIALAYAVYTWRIRVLEHRQEQHIAGLRQLLESIRVINSQLDLETVLQNIAVESAQLIGGEPGGIGLIENDQLVFRCLWEKDHWDNNQIVFRLGEGIAGRVAATAKAIIVNDPQNDPNIAYPGLIDKYQVHGFMDVPIIDRKGRVVGVLDVRNRAGRAPLNEADQHLIESLAHQVAMAIENADLYGTLAEQTLMIADSLHEIENLYKNEQEVTRALQELNQMKTNFMIVASHEMRTPLTVLKGYHESLLEGYMGVLAAPHQRALIACNRMVDRLIANFNDILEMLRINEGRVAFKPMPIDMREIIEEILAELATFIEKRGHHISFIAPDKLPLALADPDKIRLVLLNLIQNAIKFTPDTGEIQIKITSELAALHITIEDTGIGIASSELERIFEKFYTTDASHHTSGKYEFQARGAGLGLAIAKSYVEAHSGRIWAESAGNSQGSCFHVILPTATIPQDMAMASESSRLLD
ncbi:MAG: two-component regulator propeller domain-containing protein [Acidobacteriota bacterium]